VIISQAIIAWAKSRKQSLRDDHPQSVAQDGSRVVTHQHPAARRFKFKLTELVWVFLLVGLLLAGSAIGLAYMFDSIAKFFRDELGLSRPWTSLIAYVILDGSVFAQWYVFQGGRATLFGQRVTN
jgi:hypothetical protein